MLHSHRPAVVLPIKRTPAEMFQERPSIAEMAKIVGYQSFLDTKRLPFLDQDTTLGSESELQTAVLGDQKNVDLPLSILESGFSLNLQKRAAYDDTSRQLLDGIVSLLNENTDGVWENSWARFPLNTLNAFASGVLSRDLLANKTNPNGEPRSDVSRFFITGSDGSDWLRTPVSYLLKLSLAQWLGDADFLSDKLASTAKLLMGHFNNDNCSPETYSFQTTPYAGEGGRGLARETSKRFLLTHLLLDHANAAFKLTAHGQKAVAWFSPQPPLSQKLLNDRIPDAFYRDLFTNPCLSGWNLGEEKHRYMQLCHEVLSRSQLNAVTKLRDAGIITRNLVVLPNTSNISLSNNGTHVSIGSRLLTGLAADKASGFDAASEKALGDLIIKIFEHFVPLFVGTYTAAPYRIPFQDFHPETLLAFLPHQLDYTHLRMLWRFLEEKGEVAIFRSLLHSDGTTVAR